MGRIVLAKHCGDCGELKPLYAFHHDPEGVMERAGDCRVCRTTRRDWNDTTTEALDPARDLLWYKTSWQD